MPDKPKHRHTGHRERMKAEFLARGLEGWPDHRVLELLLFYTIPQGDVNDLAHELVERFGSLAGVLDASVEELKKVKGVGDHTAVCSPTPWTFCSYSGEASSTPDREPKRSISSWARPFTSPWGMA